ncbi:MAG: hypothetical protein KBT20_08915 [Bacteroidales bacterium]|nr:hypothetical protein [Candidatus Liminaster caballi]
MKQDNIDHMLDELAEAYDAKLMKEAESHIPEGFEQRLEEMIGKLEEKEQEDERRKRRPIIGMIRRYAAAACIAIAITVGFIMIDTSNGATAFADTCRTPEEARLQMERALALINEHSQEKLSKAEGILAQPTSIQTDIDISKYINFGK